MKVSECENSILEHESFHENLLNMGKWLLIMKQKLESFRGPTGDWSVMNRQDEAEVLYSVHTHIHTFTLISLYTCVCWMEIPSCSGHLLFLSGSCRGRWASFQKRSCSYTGPKHRVTPCCGKPPRRAEFTSSVTSSACTSPGCLFMRSV